MKITVCEQLVVVAPENNQFSVSLKHQHKFDKFSISTSANNLYVNVSLNIVNDHQYGFVRPNERLFLLEQQKQLETSNETDLQDKLQYFYDELKAINANVTESKTR
ncbi:unnamed protein product [Rotaria sp. Silwood1]|nr:unnamed protein product [Rotaria sp. Silwood1]CAF3817126.1 unnamed protein product [Rotaria sp. Silwood1]CAF3850857.1 unnamed protein product [Rotaria sp. Silwood1]CAF3871958.1 unnamed protein product [Rotaria sp. Silwood1]CAF4759233.1 unnamed protein product [Rotaria sp. Silwood1]